MSTTQYPIIYLELGGFGMGVPLHYFPDHCRIFRPELKTLKLTLALLDSEGHPLEDSSY